MNHDHHNMSTPEDHSKMERSKMEHSQNKGYSKHEGHSVEMFKRKFYISLILTLPVLILY